MSVSVEVDNPRSQERTYKEFRGDIDIFVPNEVEQEYLTRHGIEIHHLPNGAMVAGATRLVEDEAEAEVVVKFPTAPYYEPGGKRGVSHVLEHCIFNRPHAVSLQNEANYNAGTNPYRIALEMSGTANLGVRDYGIWPVIPVALEEVTTPLQVTEAALECEKGVVIGEMYERRQGAGNAKDKANLFQRVFLQPENPIFYQVIGTEAEVRGLQVADIEEYHQKVFIPRGTEATVFVEGTPAITEVILDQVKGYIGSMPDHGREPQSIDEDLFKTVNPDHEQGKTYKADSGEKDGQVKITYAWLLPLRGYSIEAFAQSRFMDIAQQRLFQTFRRRGLGYTAAKASISLSDDWRVLGFNLTVPKNGDPERFANDVYPQLRRDTFEGFNDDDITHINNMARKSTAAKLVSVSTRFSQALKGLRDYGQVIDPERLLGINQIIGADHLRAAQDIFVTTPPTVIINGDLS